MASWRSSIHVALLVTVWLCLCIGTVVCPGKVKPGASGSGGGYSGRSPAPRGRGGKDTTSSSKGAPSASKGPSPSSAAAAASFDDADEDADDEADCDDGDMASSSSSSAMGMGAGGSSHSSAAAASAAGGGDDDDDDDDDTSGAVGGGGGDDDEEDEDDDAAVDVDSVLAAVSAKYAAVGADDAVVTQIKPGFKRPKGQKRDPTQASAAGGSPNAAAVAVGYIGALPTKDERSEGKGYEWLHCSGWVFGNIDSLDGKSEETPQQPRNLVLGTRYSNEEMIPYETALQWLANDCGKFTLTVTPNRGKKPFLADSIAWSVSRSDKKLDKVFITALDHRVRVTEKAARQEIFAALFPAADDAPDGCTADGKPKKRRKPKRIGGGGSRKKKGKTVEKKPATDKDDEDDLEKEAIGGSAGAGSSSKKKATISKKKTPTAKKKTTKSKESDSADDEM